VPHRAWPARLQRNHQAGERPLLDGRRTFGPQEAARESYKSKRVCRAGAMGGGLGGVPEANESASFQEMVHSLYQTDEEPALSENSGDFAPNGNRRLRDLLMFSGVNKIFNKTTAERKCEIRRGRLLSRSKVCKI